MYTVDHTFSYHSKKFIRACAELSMLAHSMNSEAEILNILKLSWDLQGDGRQLMVHTVSNQ